MDTARPTLHMFVNRLGLQSWLTQSEGKAADCTARRSSASGTAMLVVLGPDLIGQAGDSVPEFGALAVPDNPRAHATSIPGRLRDQNLSCFLFSCR